MSVFQLMHAQLESCVRTKRGLTYHLNCEKGTQHGYVSSTVVFSLCINELITRLKYKCGRIVFITAYIGELCALMFADGVAGVCYTVVKLQRQVNYQNRDCVATGMELNIEKSKSWCSGRAHR